MAAVRLGNRLGYRGPSAEGFQDRVNARSQVTATATGGHGVMVVPGAGSVNSYSREWYDLLLAPLNATGHTQSAAWP
jgi:hypothetical protein